MDRSKIFQPERKNPDDKRKFKRNLNRKDHKNGAIQPRQYVTKLRHYVGVGLHAKGDRIDEYQNGDIVVTAPSGMRLSVSVIKSRHKNDIHENLAARYKDPRYKIETCSETVMTA